MIMPMPFYIKFGGVEFGTVDVTIGNDGLENGFALSPSYGSIANNTLVSVDGNIATIESVFSSDGGFNQIVLIFGNSDEGTRAGDAIQAEWSTINDGGLFLIGVSGFWATTSDKIAVQGAASASERWESGDVGSTRTIGWTA